jgi:hypothetical protein
VTRHARDVGVVGELEMPAMDCNVADVRALGCLLLHDATRPRGYGYYARDAGAVLNRSRACARSRKHLLPRQLILRDLLPGPLPPLVPVHLTLLPDSVLLPSLPLDRRADRRGGDELGVGEECGAAE